MATEWEEALIRHGIAQPKEAEITQDQLDRLVDDVVATFDPMDKKTLDELDELEDDFEDDRILEEYRRRRLDELKATQEKNKFGEVRQISEPEFKREVSEAGQDISVVLHLFQSYVPECKLLNSILGSLATKFKATKFLKITSTECIHGYPDKNLPTILIYRNGQISKQIIGLESMGGQSTREIDVEYALGQAGAIETTVKENPRAKTTIRRGFVDRHQQEDSDEDD
eukprot:TRINITY_DN79_c0_g3_i1.p2 TRINITY_DN79_c0_g3~~TRINITY_DN79_c0_g3_i1.p2  ORF type:complete len:227 (-),score=71.15 TRINITY_DN79_c0_g3_i1:204-884(-)